MAAILDLTRKEQLKIEFKYDKDGQDTVFSFEGVVSYATLNVYEQAMKKIKTKATAKASGDASIDVSEIMKVKELAEKEMFKQFFGVKYPEFEEALKDNDDSKHIILQYVFENIMQHVENIKSEKGESNGKTPSAI